MFNGSVGLDVTTWSADRLRVRALAARRPGAHTDAERARAREVVEGGRIGAEAEAGRSAGLS